MKRRIFLAAVGTAAFARPRVSFPMHPRALRVTLRGGRWYRNGAWTTADIGIDSEGRIGLGPGHGDEIIDVTGRVVSPGFIDILADNSSNPFVTYPIFEKYKVSDGVTTALQMHGGSSDADAWYRTMAGRTHAINHGVSTFVMGIRNQTRDPARRLRLVEENLEQGALGVSHSPEYQPAPFEELLAYARIAKRHRRPFVMHLRHSSEERELDGVDEGIRLAEQSGAHLHIGHLHSTGGTFHMDGALQRIRAAIGRGARITCCVYPYSYWATYLSSRRFGPGWQERYGLTFDDLRVVGTGERLTAESFGRYRRTQTLVAVPEGSMPFAKTFDLAIREDFCMIGSDGGIQKEPRANSHPRGAACFATAIRRMLDLGMPLERALEKVTVLPRQLAQPTLGARGTLEEGAPADLTVFDPAAIRGNATVENPNQLSSGLDLVLVNGKPAFQGGRLKEKVGMAIRY